MIAGPADKTESLNDCGAVISTIDICHSGIGDIYLNHCRFGLTVRQEASNAFIAFSHLPSYLSHRIKRNDTNVARSNTRAADELSIQLSIRYLIGSHGIFGRCRTADNTLLGRHAPTRQSISRAFDEDRTACA
jgi:hypothetical protein